MQHFKYEISIHNSNIFMRDEVLNFLKWKYPSLSQHVFHEVTLCNTNANCPSGLIGFSRLVADRSAIVNASLKTILHTTLNLIVNTFFELVQ